MIEVIKEKCVGCSKCVNICPFTILEMKDGYPKLIEGKKCIECLHCAAICPENALTFKGKNPIKSKVVPLNSEFKKDLKNHIMQRRSYRHFEDKKVPSEIIEEALEIAKWAPSAKNQHPTRWIVIDDKELMKKMMDEILTYCKETGISPEIITEYEQNNNNVVMGNSAALILAHGNKNSINAPADVAIAMTSVELILQAEGIGTCWAGYLTRLCNGDEDLKKLVPEIPEENNFYGAFMVGYPKDENYDYVPVR